MVTETYLFEIGRWKVYLNAETHEIAAWAEFYTVDNKLRKLNFYCDGKRDLCLYDTENKNDIPLDIKKMHISKREDLFNISKELGLELPIWKIREKVNICMRKYYDELVDENITIKQ